MSDFNIKVTAELDTSKLQSQLDSFNGSVTIKNVKFANLSSQLSKAANEAQITISKVKVDTSTLQSALNNAGKGLELNFSSKNSTKNLNTTFANLQKQYQSFLNSFTKANGFNSSGFDSIRSEVESIGTALQNMASGGSGNLNDLANRLSTVKNNFALMKDAVKAIDTGAIDKSIQTISTNLSKMGGDFNTQLTEKLGSSVDEVQSHLEELKTSVTNALEVGDVETAASKFAELQTAIKSTSSAISEIKTAQGGNWVDTSQIDNMISALSKLQGVDTSGLMAKLKEGLSNGGFTANDWSGITAEFKSLQSEASELAATGESVGSSWKNVFAAFTAGFSAVTVVNKITQALKSMASAVTDVDTAMTELKKVTDESSSSYDTYLNNATDAAKNLGSSVADYVSATSDFARLGYSFDESQSLAQVATVYSVVGDDLNGIDSATTQLISTMRAFGYEASDALTIVDKLNEVSKHIIAETYGDIGGLIPAHDYIG